MACVAIFGLAWAIGYGICRASLGSHWQAVPMTLRLGLGWAAGAAFVGMTTFWVIALLPDYRGLTVGLVSALGLVPWAIRPKQAPESPASPPENRWRRAAWWAGAAGFTAIVCVWVAHGIDIGVSAAAGGWDAWSIWTHRARYFYLCPEEWTRGFDPVLTWSHPEYPCLLPSLIVFGWLPEGRCVAASPVLIALMTQVALLLLLVGFTQAAYPRTAWPWVFGAFFATIPLEWSQEIAWQYADRPLAVFLLSAAGCLALFIRREGRGWLFLSGLFWGAAAFTKDEGKAALCVLAAGCTFALLCSLCHGKGQKTLIGIALLVLGLIPGTLSLALQHHFDSTPSRLIARMTLAPLSDLGRTDQILHFLLDSFSDPGRGWMWWGCGLTLATLAFWLKRRELWMLWVLAISQLIIYVIIFQLTPEPLTWHLGSAMPRLMFHVGPIAFLAATWSILEAENQVWCRS